MVKLAMKTFAVLVLACLPLAAGAFGLVAIAQTRNADALAIRTPAGIDEEQFVRIGGIDQWVTIRGENRDNPVILVVGGVGADGPGTVLSPFFPALRPWEHDFTVVLWDERGAGKTFAQAGRQLGPDFTFDHLTRDGLELTEYLRQRLHKPKLVLMGVGFGSTLAVRMALAAPASFSAYVGAGQIANPRPEREHAAYERVLQLATAGNDQATLADLRLSGPDPFTEPRDPARVAAFTRGWRRYNAATPPNQAMGVLTTPHWSLADALAIRAGMAASEAALGHDWGEHFDYASLGPSFQMPVFVIQGDADIDAPIDLAHAWLDRIQAPSKGFVAIPGAGDHALQTHPTQMLDALDRLVRPLAVGSKGG